jgi:hypothetical protein
MPTERPPSLSAFSEIRGFFEVFLPGLFLLLHILLLLYCMQPTGRAAALFSQLLTGNSFGVASVVGLPLGYVLGLALRLGRTSFADRLSVYLAFLLTSLRKLYGSANNWLSNAKKQEQFGLSKSIWRESLPYPGFMMAHVAQSLPPEALAFYKEIWVEWLEDEDCKYRNVIRCPKINLFRFNFFKTLVASVDDQAAREMFAAEMMVRHAAHMCYAMTFAALILLYSANLTGAIAVGLRLILLCLSSGEWFVLLFFLLPNLRLLRISEAELVFTCCFRNRNALQGLVQKGASWKTD